MFVPTHLSSFGSVFCDLGRSANKPNWHTSERLRGGRSGRASGRAAASIPVQEAGAHLGGLRGTEPVVDGQERRVGPAGCVGHLCVDPAEEMMLPVCAANCFCSSVQYIRLKHSSPLARQRPRGPLRFVFISSK